MTDFYHCSGSFVADFKKHPLNAVYHQMQWICDATAKNTIPVSGMVFLKGLCQDPGGGFVFVLTAVEFVIIAFGGQEFRMGALLHDAAVSDN